jgi:hypothetical protein
MVRRSGLQFAGHPEMAAEPDAAAEPEEHVLPVCERPQVRFAGEGLSYQFRVAAAEHPRMRVRMHPDNPLAPAGVPPVRKINDLRQFRHRASGIL